MAEKTTNRMFWFGMIGADVRALILMITSFVVMLWALGVADLKIAAFGMTLGAAAEALWLSASGQLRNVERAIGISGRLRLVYRSLMMLVALALFTNGDAALLVTVAALAGSTQLGTAVVGLFVKRVRRHPIPSIAQNIDVAQPLVEARDRWTRIGRLTIPIFAGVEAFVFVGVSLVLPDSVATALGMTAIGMITTLSATVWVVIRTRHGNSAAERDRHFVAVSQAITAFDPQALIYVVAAESEFFFVEQWLHAFNSLEIRCLFVARRGHIAERLTDTHWPVVLAPDTRSLEATIGPNTKIAFYTANTGMNVHLVRHANLKHVFLNHGDSDKASSANPVVRMYDEVWVSGEAAVERYANAGIELRSDALRLIGRPQVEHLKRGPILEAQDTKRILYAPTWEGHFEDANYSSLEVAGPALVRRMLEKHPDIGITFRPHPSTGKYRKAMTSAADEIARLLSEAANPDFHEYIAPGSGVPLFDNINAADLLISDISSVVTDFMATSRPILVSNPKNLSDSEFGSLFPNLSGCYIFGTDTSDFADLLNLALTSDPLAVERAEAERRLLGAHPEGPIRTFVTAANELYEAAAAASKVNTSTFEV
ncbi:MAG: CDP-glycerol glycerophosphotransferase family protein [Actinomycetota bacterium]|nr:CDP-glycerol glycerophosphotransferase family protein [Actinomycetota bacterium]